MSIKNVTLFIIIVSAIFLRLLPHPPNFTPIAALAIFGGVYLDKRFALTIPLLVMFLSDLFLGIHSTMIFVYGSFLITGLIGLWIKQHKKAGIIFAGTLASSILFFLITNFGVWLTGTMYAKNIEGLIECYVAAIPFFRNSLAGDLFYITIFFVGYELVISHLTTRIKENKTAKGYGY